MMYAVQTLLDAVALGSLYALAALAIGFVFGIMKLINFAQGDYITIGAYALIVPSAAATPSLALGLLPIPLMFVGVLTVVVVMALLTERLAFRPLRQSDPATLLISSFALSYFLQNMIILIYGSRPKSIEVSHGLNTIIEVGGLRIMGTQLLTLAVCIVLLSALTAFLRFSRLGIQMRAAAENFSMARLLGVPANRAIAIAFAISGILSAAVSLLLTMQTGTLDYRLGSLPVIYAFFATVIGGMGSLPGAALGGFIVGAAGGLLQAHLPVEMRPFRDAGVFLIVVLILLAKPSGLLSSKSSQERV